MTPNIFAAMQIMPREFRYVGMFFENDVPLPMYFTGANPDEVRSRMEAWLSAERAKVGLTAELVEKRKAALAAARAARKAKKAVA